MVHGMRGDDDRRAAWVRLTIDLGVDPEGLTGYPGFPPVFDGMLAVLDRAQTPLPVSSEAGTPPATTRSQPPLSNAPPRSPPATVTHSSASRSHSPGSAARTSRQEPLGWRPGRRLWGLGEDIRCWSLQRC